MEMGIRKIRELAKRFVMVNKYSPLILYAIILNVVAVFALVVSQFTWFAFAFLPLFVLYGPVSYSSADFYMRSYNLKTEEHFRLFEGFKKENIVRAFILFLIRAGFGLLFTVGFFVGLGVALGYGFHPWAAVGIGVLFLIPFSIPAFIYFARTSMSFFLLRSDTNLTAFTAFKMSITATKGNTLRLLLLFLSYLGWFLLGAITVGVTFIYAMPHFQTAKSIFFRREILEIGDEEELPSNVEERFKLLEIQRLDKQLEEEKHIQSEEKQSGSEKKRKKFDRHVIPDELDFEQQAADIRKMITSPEVILPPNARQMNPADLEIRENETFEEYRARIMRYRNLTSGKLPLATPGKRRSLEEEAAWLSQEKEKLRREAEEQTGLTADGMREEGESGGHPLSKEEAERQAQMLEEYFKTDEQVAQIVEEQIVQNTADMKSYPGPDSYLTQGAESVEQKVGNVAELKTKPNQEPDVSQQETEDAAEFEQRKKAMAEKIATLKASKTADHATVTTQTRDRRSENNDRKAQILRSREPLSGEHPTDVSREESLRTVPSRERTVSGERPAAGKPSREEILERIRRERDKK